MSTPQTPSSTNERPLTPEESDARWEAVFEQTAPVLDHLAQQAAKDMADAPFSDNDTW